MAGIKRLEGETDKHYWERVDKIIDSLDDIVRVDGQIIARLPAGALGSKSMIDSVAGILKGNYDLDEAKTEILRAKYGIVD